MPYFKVKCHKSRSNLKLQGTTNDRYTVKDFDLLLCNSSNAIFKGKSLDRGLHLIADKEVILWLKEFYKTETDENLIRASYDDWRLCLPASIADSSGVIPRTPTVLMEKDPCWFKSNELGTKLRTLINGEK